MYDILSVLADHLYSKSYFANIYAIIIIFLNKLFRNIQKNKNMLQFRYMLNFLINMWYNYFS